MRPAALLVRGNTKLGDWIYTFSIPAVATCPGRSAECEGVCYATANRFRQPSVKARYRYNLERTRSAAFVEDMVAELQRLRPRVLRLHVAGDLYSHGYTRKWVEIAGRCPETVIFLYTRSWRVPAILPAIRELASLSNVRMWYSCDSGTGVPPRDPRTRVAFMLREGVDTDADIPPITDLVFRTKDRPPRKFAGNSLICPWEQGLGGDRIGCGRCGICWKETVPPRAAAERGRSDQDAKTRRKPRRPRVRRS